MPSLILKKKKQKWIEFTHLFCLSYSYCSFIFNHDVQKNKCYDLSSRVIFLMINIIYYGVNGPELGNMKNTLIRLCTMAVTITLSQSTLECHWNATVWPSVHWDTIGWPQWTLAGYTGTPLEKLSWNCPTLECHWSNSDDWSLQWTTAGGT